MTVTSDSQLAHLALSEKKKKGTVSHVDSECKSLGLALHSQPVKVSSDGKVL